MLSLMMSAKIRGVVMKKHKIELTALSLLLVVLCYAYYDSNVKGNEQNIVLANELFSAKEINSKDDITMEMLSLSNKENEQEDKEVEEVTKTEVNDGENIYSINLAVVDNNIPYNEIISNQVINYALNFVGNPYVYGGNSLTNGTDCSGFTKLVFAEFGISLPRSAPQQAYSGISVGIDNIMPILDVRRVI